MQREQRESTNARLPPELEVTEDNMAIKWKVWKQAFEFYAIATQLNTKPAEVQAATFMSAIGPAAILIFNTFNLTHQEQQNVEIIKQKFNEYFSPQVNETYTRYVFFTCIQGKQETFDSYITKLRTKIKDCAFGDLQDSLLRDQVVRGINSDKVRELLLAEKDLTLNKAIDICRASEQATFQLKEMHAVVDNTEKDIMMIRKSKLKSDTKSDIAVRENKNKPKFNKANKICWRCGLMHEFRNCPAFNVTCNLCSLKGHYARQCKFKKKHVSKKRVIQELSEVSNTSDDEINHYFSNTLHVGELLRSQNNAWLTTVTFQNGIAVKFKLDTGAEANVITESLAKKLKAFIHDSKVKRLKSFNNGFTPVIGETNIKCIVQNVPVDLRFLVVNGNFNCILGCSTCEKLGLVKRTPESVQINEIGTEIPDAVFQGIGCLKDFEYDIELQEGANLKIHPPRRIPYAIRDTVKKEIDLMVKMKILKPVTHPTPAVSPLVIVKKGDRIRLCLDPTDINKVIKRRHFPLKTVEEIAARIGSAKYFTILDAKKGFWQIPVTRRTSDYLTVNTPWGRYSFLRIPFGLASAPEIFQQIMHSLLNEFENTECSMDDVLLWADTKEELRRLTVKVIKRLYDAGLRLNKEKCEFEKTKIKFLGHIFTSNGIEIDPSKVKAIEQLKTPTSVAELQRFIGMINYVSKFIPNFSEITEPLRRLLHKNVLWQWSEDQEKSFLKLKNILKNTPKLAYFDVNKPTVVSVDASSHAVGAVLLQNGRPIAYATKALTESQRRYPQIEKECFAIRFGCKKFHDYIYGKPVTIETDHKPLEAIAKKSLQAAPARLQRILFDVLQYSPKIVYKKGKDIPIPDALSRDCNINLEEDEEIETFEVVCDVPLPLLTFSELLNAVNEDSELQELKRLILDGWPSSINSVPPQLRKYWNFREELAVYENLLFKSERLIVPSTLKSKYLNLIHQGHLGINLSLHRAREIIFWHGMTRDIELFIQKCPVCQQTARSPNTEPLKMKPVPQFPWQRVATDMFEFSGNHYCLVVDSYSGYFDFKKLVHPSSHSVIEYLKDVFATHGIPDILESDNGPQYSSDAFHKFTKDWKIQHIPSSPHYPKSNGLAERYVQIAKLILRRCAIDRTDVRLALLNWRNTPRENLPSPAQRLFGRPTRSLIPIHPSLRLPRMSSTVPLQLSREKQRAASTTNSRNESPVLTKGQSVKLQTDHRTWIPATVSDAADTPRSYYVTTPTGKTLRRNSTHLRPTKAAIVPDRQVAVNPSNFVRSENGNNASVDPLPVVPRPAFTPPKSKTVITRSGRVVRPPERLNL